MAHERNQQALGRSEQECKADSLTLWTRWQREAWEREEKLSDEVPAHKAAFEEARVERRRIAVELKTVKSKEARAALQTEREVWHEHAKAARQRLEQLRRELYQARADMQDIQRIIDKLLGNYAPVKVANTIVDGENKPASIRPEPIDAKAEVMYLLSMRNKYLNCDGDMEQPLR